VRIEKENQRKEKGCSTYLTITKKKMKLDFLFPVLSIYQTGALTIIIDPEGNIRMESFLKKNLNCMGSDL
jgi:hypothetical protein